MLNIKCQLFLHQSTRMKTRTTLTLALFLICETLLMAASYRSASSGPWMVASSWQVFTSSWTTATNPPGSTDDVVIQSGHTINITDIDGGLSDNAHAGSIVIEAGGSLVLADTDLELFLYNTASGSDLVVNGSYQDNGSSGNGTRFQGGATWNLGSNGTFIKSNNSSASVYRDNYEGGMFSIPPSANWVIRYTGAGDPNITTIGAYYPNLRFENFAGDNWNPGIGSSRFQGSSGSATVLGNLDVGTSGGGSVVIYNQNTSGIPIAVNGATQIGFGSTLTNQGTAFGSGFNFKGGINVEGTLAIIGEETSVTIGGNGPQTISGNGTILIDNLTLFNGNGLNLARALQVNNLTMGLGKITLNTFNLTVLADLSGFHNQSYIQTNVIGESSGMLIRPVSSSVVFPIGNDQYNPAILQHTGSGNFGVRIEDWVNDNGVQQSSNIVNRTWYVEGTVNGSLNLTVQWNSAQELSGFDRSSCYMAHYTGTYWDAGPTGSASGGPPYTFTRSGITSLSPFAVASGGVLPVELTHFTSKNLPEGILLKWETASEVQNDYFAIERSADGRTFQQLGVIDGQGTTSDPYIYTFLDSHPLTGSSYYRLKQVDDDGQYTYSKVIHTERTDLQKITVSIFPNPATEVIFLHFNEPTDHPTVIQIFSITGQPLRQVQSINNAKPMEINVADLPSGTYLLRIDVGGSVEVQRWSRI